jgi:hypothetical protein
MRVDLNRLNVVFQRLITTRVLMACVGMYVCVSAHGIEEFEMVLWLRGGRRHGRKVFVVVGERCGAMAGVNLEVRI